MTVPYRKKLIEVALPLKAINAESAREKSIRHGHPSTLHLWWARRPLAACRAVLFSSLVDDPDSDPQYRKPNGEVDEDAAGVKRADLFNLIEELVMWENSNNSDVIRTARAEVARCVASRLIETGKLKKDAVIGEKTTALDLVKRGHCRPIPTGLDKKVGRVRFSFDVSRLPPAEVVNAFLAEHAPPVLDPFAGGGSIPLEAQRLGLRAYASDLNPVPVLINKALIEFPPLFSGLPPINPESRKGKLSSARWTGAQGLAEDVRYYGSKVRKDAEERIGHLYPPVAIDQSMVKTRPDLKPYVEQQLTPIAWIWARTVASPNPAASGAHVPLVGSYWLSQRPGKKAWLQPRINPSKQSYSFAVKFGEPSEGEAKTIAAGTKIGRGCKFKCLLTDQPIDEAYVKSEGMNGRLGAELIAVVLDGGRERVFVEASPSQAAAATVDLKDLQVGPIRSQIADDKRAIWCLLYGLNSFDKLFSPRQLHVLLAFSDILGEAYKSICSDAAKAGVSHATEYASSVLTYLAFALNRVVERHSTICTWDSSPSKLQLRGTFARQGIPMTWDYAEGNPLTNSSGSFNSSIEWVSKVLDALVVGVGGSVTQVDATSVLQNVVSPLVSTDPPYYDNIGYADLSDFFYVWLRRSLGRVFPELCATVLTPKKQELIASPYRHAGGREEARQFFETGFGKCFSSVRKVHDQNCPLTIYYAFRQTETESDSSSSPGTGTSTASTGWETMLEGVSKAGFSITGTWPLRTELGNRIVGLGTNALASSIALVCRIRPSDAPLATRKQFIAELRRELPEALRNLRHGSVAPVDLAQAAIGPGMGVFTRYSKVLESDATLMSIRTALGIINQVLDEVLAEQEGDFDSDTRWALAWFEQFGMKDGPFGEAETLCKAKNTAINGLEEAGVIRARAGRVRLVARDDLLATWNPANDQRLTVWETTQHLIRTLEVDGEEAAAGLLGKLGDLAEVARDLAYRLYSLCERNKWAEEALAYNGLVLAWPELTRLALAGRTSTKPQQEELF